MFAEYVPYAWIVAGIGLLILAGYCLRADPKKVDEDTVEFYKNLYEQDSRR